MIRIFNTGTGTPAASAPERPLGMENAANDAMQMAAQNLERTLATLAGLLAEMEALEMPRPGPDGKVNTAAQQAYDERLRELQGKLSLRQADERDDGLRRRAATRYTQLPVISSGLDHADVRPSGQS
ncbi:MAG: hypothetical protein ACAI38_11850 [Myxococcota bacterium]